MTITIASMEQTLALGRLIGQLAPPPPITTCIALDGELGAGKTQLARGIAEGAQVNDPTLVSSPTYVLLNIYPGPKPVHHLDAYRIHSSADFQAVGFEEILTAGGIVVVEWAQRIADLLPSDHLRIVIQHSGELATDQRRTFEITATGPASLALADQLIAAWNS